MRIALIGISHETNTFSVTPATYEEFEKGKGHIRIVYLADEDTLNTAFDRIDSFLKRHRLAKKS